jgi:uncharacterized membrane protein YeaQ/YmgE (transglycosylase-associated protein family)
MKLSLIDFLMLMLIAGICGSVAQALTGFTRGGCLVAVAVGFVGALLGTWLARLMHLPELLAIEVGGTAFPIVWSIIGGALFAAALSLLTRRRTVE